MDAHKSAIGKHELFTLCVAKAGELGLAAVLDGANLDDLADFRPGRDAARELGVRSPLLEVGLTKNEIRELSRQAGLPTAEKQPFACLASRFPYDTPLTREGLARVEHAEQLLLQLLTLGLLVAIIVSLFIGAWPSIKVYGPTFLWTAEWDPVQEKFGGLVMIYGTLMSSFIALLIAVPLGGQGAYGLAAFIADEGCVAFCLQHRLQGMVDLCTPAYALCKGRRAERHDQADLAALAYAAGGEIIVQQQGGFARRWRARAKSSRAWRWRCTRAGFRCATSKRRSPTRRGSSPRPISSSSSPMVVCLTCAGTEGTEGVVAATEAGGIGLDSILVEDPSCSASYRSVIVCPNRISLSDAPGS